MFKTICQQIETFYKDYLVTITFYTYVIDRKLKFSIPRFAKDYTIELEYGSWPVSNDTKFFSKNSTNEVSTQNIQESPKKSTIHKNKLGTRDYVY